MDVLVVNLNCLEHTKLLITDLFNQIYRDFKLTIIDQNSIENGTIEYLDSLSDISWINIIINESNISLNKLWNEFVLNSTEDIVCILNNDIRIPKNFLYDNAVIHYEHDFIGSVMHPTNHPQYKNFNGDTKMIVLQHNKYRQGWDICLKRKVWVSIPESLHFYCGDDFVFQNMYNNGYQAAIAISSPIIHYLGQTRKSKFNINLPERNPTKDIANYRLLGYTHHMIPPPEYTIVDFSQSPINTMEDFECP